MKSFNGCRYCLGGWVSACPQCESSRVSFIERLMGEYLVNIDMDCPDEMQMFAEGLESVVSNDAASSTLAIRNLVLENSLEIDRWQQFKKVINDVELFTDEVRPGVLLPEDYY